MKLSVRNVGAMPYAGNPYRNDAIQAAAWRSLLDSGADVVAVQEASGIGKPFVAPPGWSAQPASALDRHGGSVVAVAREVDADLSWRPRHPAIDAFNSYLDFALLRVWGTELAVVSVHVPTRWYPTHRVAAGIAGDVPTSARPWPSDVMLDTLIEVLDGRDAIMAGDWNEALNYPGDDDQDAARFFARAKSAGYVEAVNQTFAGPVRTNFTRGTQRSYQNDHVFMSEAVARRVTQVAVFNEPTPGVSDHAGIVVSFCE